MLNAPFLADFSIRLVFGVAVSLFFTSWRAVPLSFFRTLAQVMLGLLVLAALDQTRALGPQSARWGLWAAAVLAYLSAVAWGLGLPRLGIWTALSIAVIAAVWMGAASLSTTTERSIMGAVGRCSSGLLLGTTLTAMLLGHHYLTAPAMSIEPLKRIVLFTAGSLTARAMIAGIGLLISAGASPGVGTLIQSPEDGVFLAARWGMGFVGAGVATYMTWKTAQIRSTQSATGILYIAMIFVLFGELSAMVIASRAGAFC